MRGSPLSFGIDRLLPQTDQCTLVHHAEPVPSRANGQVGNEAAAQPDSELITYIPKRGPMI